MTSIAFIGLGNMGGPMAANLGKGGHKVTGFDLVEASRTQAKADGATIADSAASAVKGAGVGITMLPAGKHVLSVWTEILPSIAKGSLIIDCSTIDVESAVQAHALAAKHGIASVDAPVCGGTGAGHAAKICNTMILVISMIPVSEAFALAEKLGLSHQALFDVASTSSGPCWSLTSYCPVPGPVPTSPATNGDSAGFA